MKKSTLKLEPTKFALAAAIIVAVLVFIITLMALSPQFTKIATIISIFYHSMGYTISVPGAFLGAFYGFLDTFILAWIFAWLYNKLL